MAGFVLTVKYCEGVKPFWPFFWLLLCLELLQGVLLQPESMFGFGSLNHPIINLHLFGCWDAWAS